MAAAQKGGLYARQKPRRRDDQTASCHHSGLSSRRGPTVTGGNVADITMADTVTAEIVGCYVVVDMGYDSNDYRRELYANNNIPVIPGRKNRKSEIVYDKVIYRWRRRIEIFPGLRRGRLWKTQGKPASRRPLRENRPCLSQFHRPSRHQNPPLLTVPSASRTRRAALAAV
jgi:hypothetical protein